MSILVNENTRVIVQGITGREGQVRTRLMQGYGPSVAAGVTPGRGGEETLGLPVFDTVAGAVNQVGAVDASVVFVPATLAADAAMEAMDAGVKFVVIVPDRVPLHDVMKLCKFAEEHNARFLGPNTLGCLSPGKGVLGMMGGSPEAARDFFAPGRVGVTSRSGGITSSIAYYLKKAGIGTSTIVHVGGDSIVGLPHPEILRLFEEDAETDAVVMFGEIGTTQEERVAEMIRRGDFTKPLVAYIGGKQAEEGTRFSHAGAIVEGGRGDYQSKVSALGDAGAVIVERFEDLPSETARVLAELNGK
ncbi:CoA-binding protein [bacterium]|nr:CoA-binding protein [bacterium]